jgi:hypothetical protein
VINGFTPTTWVPGSLSRLGKTEQRRSRFGSVAPVQVGGDLQDAGATEANIA